MNATQAPPPPTADLQARVVLALVTVQVFFGLHYLATKLVLVEIEPRAWAWLRVTGAALLLLAVARALRRTFPCSAADLGRLALFSILGVTINQLCFIEGLSRTTPTHSALINTTIPVGTLAFAVALGHERPRARKLLALAVALVGLLLVIRPGGAGPATSDLLVGDLLTLTNATSYALFLVLSKRLIGRSDPLAATALLMAFGAIGISLVSLPAVWRLEPTAISLQIWGLAALIVLFPTAGAYVLIYWALARVESSVVALFIYLQPIIATALSMVFLGERPGLAVYVGAMLIFVGVYLAVRRQSSAPVAAPAG